MASGSKGKASNIFVWIILALLIFGLAGFGVTNFGGSSTAVAAVGDTEVDVNTYARSLQNELRAVEAQTGQSMPLSQAVTFGFDRAVIQRLLSGAALDEENNRIGLSVGDDVVARELVRFPQFQGLSGSFDRESYDFYLSQTGQNERDFEETLRSDTARTLLQGAVVNGLAPSETQTDAILTFVSEQRSVDLVRVTTADVVTTQVEPSDADLNAYYDANPDAFTLPERKSISYAWVTPDMILNDIEVDEAALEALYNERLAQYVRPERRLAERLVFPDVSAAQEALDRYNANTATFEELVAERGLALSDIDLGDVTPDGLSTETAEAIFGLLTPGVVGPLDTDFGPALFRMNAILAAHSTSFEEARPALLSEYAADRARRVILDSASNVDDLLAGGATLQELADETDMVLGHIDWSVTSEDGIAAYAQFAAAAAAVQDGDFAEVVELLDGGIFALQLDEIIEPTLQPLADVQDAVRVAVKRDQLNAALSELAQTHADSISGGSTIEDLGLTATQELGLTRDSFLEVTAPDMMTDIFELEIGKTIALPGEGEAYVVTLTDILAPDLTDPDTAQLRDTLNAQNSQSVANDLLEAFIVAVQNEAGITLNQATVNAVHAQFP
ncbi:MAG: peptidyl-prolyl cis-trans isomerase [Pseudoruegeria sp.]